MKISLLRALALGLALTAVSTVAWAGTAALTECCNCCPETATCLR